MSDLYLGATTLNFNPNPDFSRSSCDIIATGGRGDKCIFVYQSDSEAKLLRLQKLQGHQGNKE